MSSKPGFVAALLVLAALAAPQISSGAGSPSPEAPATQAQEPEPPSLFARLGGVYPIAAVVDAFIERLLANDVLNANPAISDARKRVPAPGLKFQVTALVCQVTGGGCNYTGRGMTAAHAHLGISTAEWNAMVADFVATLDQFKVPEREQQELLAIVESTRKEIVSKP
jgi:hemoglobin